MGSSQLPDLRGTLPVTQGEWGIEPYRGMMGAIKVRDTIEVILDVPLDLGPWALVFSMKPERRGAPPTGASP